MDAATTARAEQGRSGTVRSLYEAAMREVRADPIAAVTKYQPNWLDGLTPHAARSGAGQSPARSRRR